MKGRTIIFGSIIACFLMLLVPNISAIEFKGIKENITVYNEKELIDAIKDRIEQLRVQNPYPKITLNGDDPDGPLEGGLDDFFDWLDLFSGIISGCFFLALIYNHNLIKAILTFNIYTIMESILEYGLYTWATLTSLGDAFDVIELDQDGY